MKKIREKGVGNMEFEMDEEFRKKFKMKDKSVIFTTHKQLDEFVYSLLEQEKYFVYKYRYIYSMRIFTF